MSKPVCSFKKPIYYMQDEALKEWLADLRANPKLQGRGWLCSDGLYCCWGRLAKISVEKGHGTWVGKEEALPIVPKSLFPREYKNSKGSMCNLNLFPLEEEWLSIVSDPGNDPKFQLPSSPEAKEEYGSVIRDLEVIYKDKPYKLADLNDGNIYVEALTFLQIANLIEEHFRPLSLYKPQT